jgi:pilus assembly protein CpaF
MELKSKVWGFLKEVEKASQVNEIAINDLDRIFIEKNSIFTQLSKKFEEKDLYMFIDEVAVLNKSRCDQEHPIFNGSLPDGSRINIILPPFVSPSPAITIRKFSHLDDTLDIGLKRFGLNEKWIDFVKALISARFNFIICGGTSSGKTSFLNTVIKGIHPAERLIVIEDTLELKIQNANCVRMEVMSQGPLSRVDVDLSTLVKNSLRMRPDRIVIGEVRSKEVADLIQSMNTGHSGSLTTVHANSSVECLSRLETLYMMGGKEIPLRAVRAQIQNALDFIIQLERIDAGKRVVSEIREITGMEGDVINTQLLAKFSEGELKVQGVTPSEMERLHRYGGLAKNFFQMEASRR